MCPSFPLPYHEPISITLPTKEIEHASQAKQLQKQGLSHTAFSYTRLHIIKFTTLIISGLQSMGEWYHYFIDHKT